MTQRIVITVDGGVDRLSALEGSPSMYEAYSAKLKSMKIGDSFFVADLMSGELNGLIRFAQDNLRVFLNAHHLDLDPIYRTNGLRVWRVEETEYKAPVATDSVYYLHIRSGLTYKVPASTPPSPDADVVRITYDEYMSRPDYTGKHFQWATAEGDTWWTNDQGAPILKHRDDKLVGEHRRIDHATYLSMMYQLGLAEGQNGAQIDKVVALQNQHSAGLDKSSLPDRASAAEQKAMNELLDKDAEPIAANVTERTFAYHAESDSAVIFEPGDKFDPQCDPITEDEYVAKIKRDDVETYWKKSNGTVVAVPSAKITAALGTKGAVSVSRIEYGEYLAEQNDL